MEVSMRIDALKASAVDWFLSTIMPQMSIVEQAYACLKIWQNADKLMGVFVDEIQKSGLMKDGDFDADTALREIVDGMMFKFRDYIPVKIGESEYRTRKENIREIFENAKHL